VYLQVAGRLVYVQAELDVNLNQLGCGERRMRRAAGDKQPDHVLRDVAKWRGRRHCHHDLGHHEPGQHRLPHAVAAAATSASSSPRRFMRPRAPNPVCSAFF
jgi:hypothetical protein